MQHHNLIKVLCSTVMLCVTLNVHAMDIDSNTHQMNVYGHSQSVHSYSDEATFNTHKDETSNRLIKQPAIAEPATAQIDNGQSTAIQHSMTYVLKKKPKNRLGGSSHQNRFLKQYLGKHY